MRLKLLLLLLFIVLNTVTYVITQINATERVEIALESKLNELEKDYKTIEYQQNIVVQNTLEYINNNVMDILSRLPSSSKQDKDLLREELYNRLLFKYKQLQKSGVYQFQICLPDNRTFLRMHKPEKYGDDLSGVRYSFEYTNKTKKPIEGFEGGKTIHGLRYIRPVFDRNGNYLCALEVSFSSSYVQNYLTTISSLHSHFLVNKSVFKSNTWKTKELNSKYIESAENNDYMLLLTKQHIKEVCVIDNKKKLEPFKNEISENMDKGKTFSIFVNHDQIEHYGNKNLKNHVDVISFLPIKDTKNNVAAWIVSYSQDSFIPITIWGLNIVRIVSFFIFLIFIYLAYKVLNQKNELQKNVFRKTRELSDLSSKLNYYIRSIQSILVILDKKGNITLINPAASKLLGYEEDELKGKNWFEVCLQSNEADKELKKYISHINHNKKTKIEYFESNILTKTGDIKHIAWQNAYLYDKKGDISGILSSGMDITEQNKMKKLIEYQKGIIEGQVKVAIAERDRAKEFAKAKGEFLANMSHEIRTPLNAIIGFIELLREKETDSEKQKYLDIVNSSSNNLLGIINDILDFSKIESGKISIEKIDFNPIEEFKVTKRLFKAKASQKDITMYVSYNKFPPSLNGDILRIKQVINNLISNATKFTPKGKSIYLDIEYTQGFLKVSVKDEGIGISKEYLETIFDKFSQEDSSTTRKYGGSGLGLAISYELVNLMGGELKVKSEQGKGSEFYFSIPLKEGQPVETEPDDIKIGTLKGKVLLAEDNEANQMFMEVVLKKMALRFDIVNDGLEALNAVKKNSYDVILMDENMPNMNGMEAVRNIIIYEKENNLSHTPVIALTANALKGDRERFLEAGMDEYLSKPVNMKRLYKSLSKFLEADDQENISHSVKKDLPEFETLNKEYALNLVMGMENALIQILKGIVKYKSVEYTNLDDQEFQRIMHSLKGLLASAGALDLSSQAKQIEQTLDRELLPEFVNELNKIIEEIEQKIIKTDSIKENITKEKRDSLFTKLKEAVKTKRAKNCRPVLDELEKYDLEKSDRELFNEVKLLTSKFQFKQAAELL
jgi:PAS domain S-box-containing protein